MTIRLQTDSLFHRVVVPLLCALVALACSSCAEGSGGSATVLASDGVNLRNPPSHLFEIDPSPNGADRTIGIVHTPDGGEPVITDLARSPSGQLFGTSFRRLFAIDPGSALASPVGAEYGGGLQVNALVFRDDGALFGGTLNGVLVQIDPLAGGAFPIGSYGSDLVSSGDMVFRSDGVLLGTLQRQDGQGDFLAAIDPSTGGATVLGAVGFPFVFGLEFVDDTLIGLTAAGAVLRIDPHTGAGMFVRPLSFPAFGAA